MRMRTLKPGEPSQVTEKTLFAEMKERQSFLKGTNKKKRSMRDDMASGLRFYFWKSGAITHHVQYTVGDKRRFPKIGTLNQDADDHMTLAEARDLTKIFKGLGDRGIDVEKAQRKRLLAELKRDGIDRRPTLNDPPQFRKSRKQPAE